MDTDQHSKVHMDSMVFGWGSMRHGQLGFGGIEDEQIFVARELSILSQKQVKEIAAGVEHTIFVMQDGLVYSCGNNDNGQLGHHKARRKPELIDALETQVVSFAACGMAHSVAVNNLSQVFTWGDNEQFQLGRTTTDPFTHLPKMVKELSSHVVIQVACGYQHTLVLTDDSQLFSWGRNVEGQLGISHPAGQASAQCNSAVQCVKTLQGIGISQIAAGGHHSVALTVSGALFAWGHNRYGQLGVGDEKDRKVPTLCESLQSLRVKYVTCGEEHTAVLTQDGGVLTFGAGTYGQLGHGSAQSEKLPRKVFELMGSVVTMIACGRRHTLACVEGGNKLHTFGLGGNGQLGQGNTTNRLSPTPVKALCPQNHIPNSELLVVSISAGGDQCFVLAVQPPSQLTNSQIRQLNVSSDFRSLPAKKQILTLTADTVHQYSAINSLEKPNIEFQNRIEKVFKSSSCLNASFLTKGDQHFFCSETNHGVSISEAEEIFELIKALKNEYIKQIILGAIEKTLIPSLMDTSTSIGIERLRLFLTLPCLHYFDNPAFYETVICPFAFVILFQLGQTSSKILESWWLQLGAAYLLRLIQIFKAVLLYILDESSTQVDFVIKKRRCGIFVCLEMLGRLHVVNENSSQSAKGSRLNSPESFYVPELKDKVELREDYISWLRHFGLRLPVDITLNLAKLPLTPEGKTLHYCNYPFIFDGLAKTLILQVDSLIQRQKAVDEATRQNLAGLFLQIDLVNPCLILQVDRNNLVHDTLSQLSKQSSDDYKKPLKIIFRNEEALDAGGVKKEFFLLLLKEVLDPKYGMFEYFSESRLIWFNQESFETSDMYGLIGVLCGLAIYNCIIIDINLPLALYRKLLKKKITLDDLKQLQPSIGRSMQQLLDYDGDDFEEVFGISFEITRQVYDQVKVIELIPDGSKINVTQANKQKFVDAYIDYVFNTSMKEQFDAFNKGFHKVCGGHILDLFQPQELQALVVGNENYDWQELEENTEYKGDFSTTHPTIQMFWNVFHNDLSTEDKKKFLLFLTGSDRVPILGMKSVKLHIQPVNVDDRYLPVAHTCFNLLDLPMYSDRETMRRKVLQAVEHTHGFGLV